ncbi:hypothetical protein X802_01495 [Thermococcus guaymasensis DSM 11113]|uniref:Uncharacterized protein n=1 Tax=Thermococcus guaymasensis DSM 11113 TaxID=1432656 RepID=A0A0X1KIC7_9EURY|nr:hypothetical protein [Thermococcus guaymasensis]AJC71008.1 hypothetical protein X802_01495 [Thermococcus guaymasensis DSM 11113]
MNATLFALAVVFIVAATYVNMKGSRKLGLVLSGIAGGLAASILLHDRLNQLIAFAVGFALTVAVEEIKLIRIKR